jgi:Ca-activated chloride channel homolog
MDPNKTIQTSFDPNRTAAMPSAPAGDPNRTMAMGSFDPNRTAAMGAAMVPSGPALTATLTPSRTATMANGPAREQFLLELMAGGTPGAGGGVRTPMNLCLVIDRSGSMEGMPLEYAKQACSFVVDLLSPDDILSIVTFEEVVDLLMPPQRVTSKQPIKDGIGRIMPGNTTNLHGGIALGLQQVLQSNEAGRVSRMVVLSDGDPTAGIKDFGSLTQFASEIKAKGVTCTFLGFGPDYNEELLAGMAKRAAGNYYFIPRPEMIPEIFRTELQKLMTVSVRNVSLDLKLARWVSAKSVHGQGATDREFTVALSDMERGTNLTQVFDFEFANHPLGWYRVAAGTLRYEDCATGQTQSMDVDFVMEFTADAARYSAPVDTRVRSAADVALVSRTVEKTMMGLKTMQISPAAAMAELQKTQMLLTAEGRTQEAQEVTMALRAIQSGDTDTAQKTLMGTMVNLDQGKR